MKILKDLVVTGNASAANLSGTNTGDQDLTGYMQKANNLSDVSNTITALLNLGGKPYHGVVSRSLTPGPLPTHLTSTTFTLGAAAFPIDYYHKGKLVSVTTDKTTTLSGAAGLYFIFFDGITGNISNGAFPGFTYASNVLIASVFWNGTNYGLVNDERHGYARNLEWHLWAHTTVGCRYISGLTLTAYGTGVTATFATTAGEIADEDIQFAISASSAFPNAFAGRMFYQSGASTYAFVNTTDTVPFYRGPNNRPYVVNATTYALTELPSAVNRYCNIFVYATTDVHTPIYFVSETMPAANIGAGGYTSIANARAVPFPNLAAYGLGPELKPIYRIVVRADGDVQTLTADDDYRTVSSLPMSAGNTSTTASSVSYNPTSPLTQTTVQTALDEVATNFVPGISSATDNALVRFDGTTGKLIQNSNATLNDAGDLNISGDLLINNQIYLQVDTNQNNFIGYGVGNSTLSGVGNFGFGYNSLSGLTSGNSNVAIGQYSLYGITSGSGNIAIGVAAGNVKVAGDYNTAGNASIFIGSDTRPLDANDTNEIVIGHNAAGRGSNTTTIGNSSTATTKLFGQLIIGTVPAITRTNNTAKTSCITSMHYTNAEEPQLLIQGYADATQNIVNIGGGTSSANTSTAIVIWGAENTTTIRGTEVARFNTTGLGLGTNNPSERLHVVGNGLFSQDVASATKTIGGKVRMEYDTATDTLEFNFI
jgi:hypothetical protein